jgi:hypothetical protein
VEPWYIDYRLAFFSFFCLLRLGSLHSIGVLRA